MVVGIPKTGASALAAAVLAFGSACDATGVFDNDGGGGGFTDPQDACESIPNIGCPCESQEECIAGDPCEMPICADGYCDVDLLEDGVECGGGEVCWEGSCLEGCFVDGDYVEGGASMEGNACMVCDPGTNAWAWSDGCPAGSVCSHGECLRGCTIQGEFHHADATDPANPCMICDPDESATQWSDACPAGSACSDGECVVGCTIGGVFYFPDEANPANACMVCDPDEHTEDWSDVCLTADLYDHLPVSVHMGIDSGELHRPNRSMGWHGRSGLEGALDYPANRLPIDSFPTVRFSADAIDDVTGELYPGESFEIEVYGKVESRWIPQIYTDSNCTQRAANDEMTQRVDVYYVNPISGRHVRVARISYTHLDHRTNVPAVGARVEVGERVGNLATWDGSSGRRYRISSGTCRLTSTAPHLHLEVGRIGWADWGSGTVSDSGYEGVWLEGYRAPFDIAGSSAYSSRFPNGTDTYYSWCEPAFYFNDYHIHDPRVYEQSGLCD